MVANKVIYRNFRNIGTAELSFSDGVNILYGDNAQGKTNALEGIFFFACGKSFRGVHDRELLKIGCPTGEMSLSFTDARREQKLETRFSSEKPRTLLHNGIPVRRTSDFIGAFRSVLFCPEHLSLIQGAPAGRRSFLDAAICQLKPAYLSALSVYNRLLRQRNALLRDETQDAHAKLPLLEVLTGQLAEADIRIVTTRKKYIKLLEEAAAEFLSDMTREREHVTFTYQSDAEPAEDGDFAAAAEKCCKKRMAEISRELAAGTTLHGCHRDDILISLDGREARLYASQGQDRSIALAMKLAEGELSRAAGGEYPVFLFDDVLSELDRARQRYLLRRLDARQVILTSCNEELFSGMDANLIHVENGVFQNNI